MSYKSEIELVSRADFLQVVADRRANDMLLALENEAVAGPVFRVDMPDSSFVESHNERLLMLIRIIRCWNLLQRDNRASQENQQYDT